MTPKETILIKKIVVETHRRRTEKQFLDLTKYLTRVEITEDIFSNNSIATLFLAESANIISSPLDESYTPAPIIGNERVHITFVNPLMDNKIIDVKFRIHSISQKMLINTKSLAYIINLVSDDILIDQKLKVSRSFKSKKYSTVVSSLLTNDIKVGKNNKGRELEISETDKPKDFVIPYWSPFKAINWMASRSISPKYLGSAFLFFENVLRNAYVFASLEELYEKKSVKKLTTSIANIYDVSEEANKAIEETKIRVNKYDFVGSFNILRNLTMGMYANTLLQYDTLNKKYVKRIFNYEQTFPGLKHLNNGKLVSPLPDNFNKTFYDYPEQNISIYPKGVSFPIVDESSLTYIPFRRSQLQQLNNIRIRVQTAGDFNLNVGETIDLKLASVFNATVNIKHEKKLWDKYYSGKYLITGIRHNIRFETYAMTLELSKDTLGKEEPEDESQLSLG